MRKCRLWVPLAGTAILTGCGGLTPQAGVAGTSSQLSVLAPQTFTGGELKTTVTVANPPDASQLTVAALLTDPNGGTTPVSVVREGDDFSAALNLPPNLTTQSQTYTVTVIMQAGEMTQTQSQQITVPGLDAPALNGGDPVPNGPAIPDF